MSDDPRLFLVVADADAEMFLRGLVRRGIERGCLRQFEPVVRRDPMRDSSVCRQPAKTLVDAKRAVDKVLVTFDLAGSGREASDARDLEATVQSTLVTSGFAPENVACVVFDPELEVLLAPEAVWTSVAARLAERRKEPAPADAAVFARTHNASPSGSTSWNEHLARDPKDCFDALLRTLRLRHEPAIFAELGQHLSLSGLKEGTVAARFAAHLVQWFGAAA